MAVGIVHQKPLRPKVFLKKEFIESYTSREGTRSWGVWSKPPAAGRDGEDKLVCCPGIDGAVLCNELGEDRLRCFEGMYIGYGLGGWKREVGDSSGIGA